MYRVLSSVLVAFEVDVLVFEPSPETLNPAVAQSPALSVHANLNAIVFKNLYENIRCELASLLRIEDCKTAIFLDCLTQNVRIQKRVHRVEHMPAQNLL